MNYTIYFTESQCAIMQIEPGPDFASWYQVQHTDMEKLAADVRALERGETLPNREPLKNPDGWCQSIRRREANATWANRTYPQIGEFFVALRKNDGSRGVLVVDGRLQ